MFHHGSLEFTPEVLPQVHGVCAAVPTVVDVYLERPAVLTPLVEHAGAIIANFGVGGEPDDIAFDTADPAFRFGHGLRYR